MTGKGFNTRGHREILERFILRIFSVSSALSLSVCIFKSPVIYARRFPANHRDEFPRNRHVDAVFLGAPQIGPAMPSNSGGLPAATSFCIELRPVCGVLSKNVMIADGVERRPAAVPTAATSRSTASSLFRQAGSRIHPPIVSPEAVVVSANGARKDSFVQRIFISSATN